VEENETVCLPRFDEGCGKGRSCFAYLKLGDGLGNGRVYGVCIVPGTGSQCWEKSEQEEHLETTSRMAHCFLSEWKK
jgi:hypothetical protein